MSNLQETHESVFHFKKLGESLAEILTAYPKLTVQSASKEIGVGDAEALRKNKIYVSPDEIEYLLKRISPLRTEWIEQHMSKLREFVSCVKEISIQKEQSSVTAD